MKKSQQHHGHGVSYEPKRSGRKKFRARLFYKGQLDLGRYETAHKACLAYDQAVRSIRRTGRFKLQTNYAAGTYDSYFPHVQAIVDQFIEKHPELDPSLPAESESEASSNYTLLPQAPGSPAPVHNSSGPLGVLAMWDTAAATAAAAVAIGQQAVGAAAAPTQPAAGAVFGAHGFSFQGLITAEEEQQQLAASEQQPTEDEDAFLHNFLETLLADDFFLHQAGGPAPAAPHMAAAGGPAPAAAQVAAAVAPAAAAPAAVAIAAVADAAAGLAATGQCTTTATEAALNDVPAPFMGMSLNQDLVQFVDTSVVHLMQLYNQLLLLPSSQAGVLLMQQLAAARQASSSSPTSASKVQQAVVCLLSRLVLLLVQGSASSGHLENPSGEQQAQFVCESVLTVAERLMCALMQLRALCSSSPGQPLGAFAMQLWVAQLVQESSMPGGQAVLSLVQQLQSSSAY